MPTYSGTHAAPRIELGVAMREFIQQADEFIGHRVLPGLMVPKKTAYFSKLEREGFLRTCDVKRVARSGYNRDTFSATDDSYACIERGLEGPLDDDEREFYMGDFDAEVATVETITRRVLTDYENDIEAAVFNTSTWTGGSLTTSVSTEWSTTTSNPMNDVKGAKEYVRSATGIDANTLIISKKVYNNLLVNEYILERMQYAVVTNQGTVESNLAGILGLEKILVGKGVYNSAKEGQDATITDIWDDEYAMVCLTGNEDDNLMVPQLGRTFIWSADAPVEAGGCLVEQYRDEKVRGDVYRARMHTDEIIFDSSYGHLLSNITA